MYATYLWTEDPFDITEFKINIIEIIYPSKKKKYQVTRILCCFNISKKKCKQNFTLMPLSLVNMDITRTLNEHLIVLHTSLISCMIQTAVETCINKGCTTNYNIT